MRCRRPMLTVSKPTAQYLSINKTVNHFVVENRKNSMVPGPTSGKKNNTASEVQKTTNPSDVRGPKFDKITASRVPRPESRVRTTKTTTRSEVPGPRSLVGKTTTSSGLQESNSVRSLEFRVRTNNCVPGQESRVPGPAKQKNKMQDEYEQRR